jgi:hypothetical protein
MLIEFFPAAAKPQRDQGGGRILLGDNTGVGAVMLRPIRLNCVCLDLNWSALYIAFGKSLCT